MKSPQEMEKAIIAPQYDWLEEEFTRLRAKLEAAFVSPCQPRGLAIVNGRAALKIWERCLGRTIGRLPFLFAFLANTVFAKHKRPRRRQAERVIIAIEQEVNRLIALRRQLWQQPLATRNQEGQLLLSRCIDKIAADLNDLLTFFVSRRADYGKGLGRGGSLSLGDKGISCRAEMVKYKRWFSGVDLHELRPKWSLSLSRFFYGVSIGGQGRGVISPDQLV